MNSNEKNTFYGLPWILRDNGYTAWAFHGYEKDFWNRDRAYVNQGFQRYVNQDDFDMGDHRLWDCRQGLLQPIH